MEALKIRIEAPQPVTGLLLNPPDARVCFVLAHGAGAGKTHPFMNAVTTGLFDRGIATLRYKFLYMRGRTVRKQPTQPFAPPLPRRCADARSFPLSRAASRSAPA